MDEWPDFLISSSQFSSATKDVQAVPVGAGVTDEYLEPYFYHDHVIKWITETKEKIPRGTPTLRKEAFLADSLIKGTIYPYLRNTLLKDWSIETDDNKLYAEAIKEIKNYITKIKLVETFRDSFLDLYFLVGHTYHRADPDIDKNIIHLEKIEPSSVTTYTDPWDSSVVAYHQHATVKTSWSEYGTSETVDSWFIPFLGAVKNIFDTWVEGRVFGNSNAALFVFNDYKDKYNITDVQKLRIAAAERVIAMHHEVNFKLPHDDRHYDVKDYGIAPMDSVIVPVFLKKLISSCSPNLIYAVLNPFLHATMGVIKESKDNTTGKPIFINSNPDKPAPGSADYAAQVAKYNAFLDAFRKLSDNVMKNYKNGGVVTTGPDVSLKPIESSRNVTHQFIQGLNNQLDDEICYNFGLPKALISSKGAELATSRTVAELFNAVHAGEIIEYESVADRLILKQFGEKTWTVKTDEGTVTFSFEEINAHFKLKTLNEKDLKSEAETLKLKSETLTNIKALGASQDDLIALGDEYGFGMLGLDNFSAPVNPEEGGTSGGGAAQINAILKACLMSVMEEQGLISAVSPTEPSGFKEKEITDKLQEAYQVARETIDVVFEEH